MSITTIGDHLIHYEALGRGEPLIFIHGWLGSWRYWWPSMQALSTHYRVFAFDLWGYGDSSKAVEKYTFAEYVAMLDNFVERLGILRPVTVVGHALGAAVGLRYAAHQPEAVKRLATVALPIQGEYINSRLIDSDSSSVLERVLGRQNSFPEVESELRKTDDLAMNQVAQEMVAYDFAGELEDTSFPVLLLFGDDDPVIEQPSGAYAHFRQPRENRAYVSFPACNHFPMLEEKAQFNRLILEFLRADSDLSDLSPKEYWQRRTH
jgi:pimeloyl-ACP methyl ester carboxylesterase